MMPEAAINDAVEAALLEDLGPNWRDLTTEAVVGKLDGMAEIVANDEGTMAGQAVAAAVFRRLDAGIAVEFIVEDGGRFEAGRVVTRLRGPAGPILTGERTALNFLAHLSGVASATRLLAEAVEGTGARIFDTRKTLPGLRTLEKYAVTAGGGANHRAGLYDAVLIKDNHLAVSSVAEAVAAARKANPDMPIEVEVENDAQLDEALAAGADIVLLDNMAGLELERAIGKAKDKVEIEVSGGIDAAKARLAALAGAKRISAGAITQGARPIDFSMTLRPVESGRQ